MDLLHTFGASDGSQRRWSPTHDRSAIAYFVKVPGPLDEAVQVCRVRIIGVGVLFALALLLLVMRLFDVSILNHKSQAEMVREQSDQAVTPVLARADLVDRDGRLLATNLRTSSVYANPRLIEQANEVAAKLVKIFPDLNQKKIAKSLASKRGFVWIKRNITPDQQFAVNALGVPGINFQTEEQRVYPHGRLLSHVLGYVDVDNKGIAGLEKTMNSALIDPERAGDPLALSIDIRVQHALHETLSEGMQRFKAKSAAGIVMDAYSGEIMGMVSLPDFDPHQAGSADKDAKFNRTTLGVYEMGSTFKSFTMAMALDSGLVELQDSFDATHPIQYANYTIRDDHPQNRWLNVSEIFKHSSNIGTVHIAERIGKERQLEYFKRLGLTDIVDVELSERTAPLLPSPWREVNMMTASFGHGIAVSPLHMVRANAALINGGILPHPTLIKNSNPDIAGEDRVLKTSTSLQMRHLMRMAVRDGTGRKSDVVGYPVGGKTGTAEKASAGGYAKKRLVSSFAGAFPMNNPRYVTLVLLDEPQGTVKTHGFASAGWTAAPLTGALVERIAPMLGIEPLDVPEAPLVQEIHYVPQ